MLSTRLTRDPRPGRRGQDQEEARPPGERHLPGEDGQPEVRGERERGNTAQYDQHHRIVLVISSHCLTCALCIYRCSVNTQLSNLHHALADSDNIVVHRSGETLSVPPALSKADEHSVIQK